MNTFRPSYYSRSLLSAPINGAIWLVVLFLVVFLGVHLVKLARLGIDALPSRKREDKTSGDSRKPPNTENARTTPAQPPPDRQPEPVYYIVERKQRRRPKETYSPPKEIRFK